MNEILDEAFVERSNDELNFASYGSRMLAVLIDTVILIAVNMILATIFGFGLNSFTLEGLREFSAGTNDVIYSIVALVIYLLFYVFMEASSKSGTLGKIACRIIVVDLNGDRIGYIDSVKRTGFKCIYSFVNLFAKGIQIVTMPVLLFSIVDYLYPLWDKKKQCLHDKFAKTYVIINN